MERIHQIKMFIKNKDSYKFNWQTPIEVIEFVKNNYNKVQSIGIFDVYEKQ